MLFKRVKIIIYAVILSICACGEDKTHDIQVRGMLTLGPDSEFATSPLFVAITDTYDIDLLEDDPMEHVLKVGYVDRSDPEFNLDLSDTDAREGDEVYIIAFADNNYENGLPNPDAGDVIGFYVDSENYELAYKLQKGDDNYVEININRVIYDFETEISGNIICDTAGKVIVAAHAGEIITSEDSDFNIDAIVGFDDYTIVPGTTPYTLDILPYGFNVPINGVYILALLDANDNGKPDEFEKIGYYLNTDAMDPTITIPESGLTGIDITLDKIYHENDVSIEGSLTGDDIGDVLVVAYNGDLNTLYAAGSDLSALDLNRVISFQTFWKNWPVYDYSMGVLPIHAFPIKEVFVAAILDRNENRLIDAGDKIGYYINISEMSLVFSIWERSEIVSNIDIAINKKVYEHNASITFKLEDPLGKTKTGDQVIVFVVQNAKGLTYDQNSGEIDYTNLITDYTAYLLGMDYITVGEYYDTGNSRYKIDIFPFIHEDIPVGGGTDRVNDPLLTDLFLIAVVDTNNNGFPDSGEKIGYHYQFLPVPYSSIAVPYPFAGAAPSASGGIIDGENWLDDVSDSPDGAGNVRITNAAYNL